MIIEISEDDLALCIAALEYGAKEMKDGQEASDKLGISSSLLQLSSSMNNLKERLLAFAPPMIQKPDSGSGDPVWPGNLAGDD